jgi:chemotaxis signal transduction protein
VTEDMTVTTPDAAEAMADAVVVRIGGGRYALGLAQVAEVGKVPPLTRVPGVPAWLDGVANWRGRILPVLDLRPLLGADVTGLGPAARLVVLTTDAVTAGVLVDAVEGTAAVGGTGVPVPALLPGAGAELVHSQVPLDDGPLAVLDVGAVMRLRERLPSGCRSA